MHISLPEAFCRNMETQLGPEYPAFYEALHTEGPVSIRTNPGKLQTLPSLDAVPWHPQGFYLPQRPLFTGDPWLHAGGYYVQEASSMAVPLALAQHMPTDQPLRVLDLCGAPGGKSTALASVLNAESLLVTNEVVKARAQVLTENLIKWGYPNTVVTHNDPTQFQSLPDFFDVVVVDAPCSGEGLFRRDPDARTEWSEEHVQLCAQRQRRILSDIWDCLKPGGLLIYSTCTYNLPENEDNLAWAQAEMGAQSLPLEFPAGAPVAPSLLEGVAGYHFYPHRTRGEGLFLSALRKPGDWKVSPVGKLKKPKLALAKRDDLPLLNDWLVEETEWDGFWQGDTLVAIPKIHMPALDKLARNLYILHAGTPLAERTKKKPNPTPALALSIARREDAFPVIDADLDWVLQYLRREDVMSENTKPGWALVRYAGLSLGWIKVLPNRANNYWPTPWRIRKDLKDAETWTLSQHLP